MRTFVVQSELYHEWLSPLIPQYVDGSAEGRELLRRVDEVFVRPLLRSPRPGEAGPNDLGSIDDFADRNAGADSLGQVRLHGRNADTRNVNFAVWVAPGSPDSTGQLPAALRETFSRFAETASTLYRNTRAPSYAYYEHVLASALGLPTDSGSYPVLAVPWIILADRDTGYEVSFPASGISADSLYDPRERPWFLAIARRQRRSPVPGSEDTYLTYPYSDIDTDLLPPVRSLVKEFTDVGGNNLILAIDLVFVPPGFEDEAAAFPPRRPTFDSRILLDAARLHNRIDYSLGIMLLLLVALAIAGRSEPRLSLQLGQVAFAGSRDEVEWFQETRQAVEEESTTTLGNGPVGQRAGIAWRWLRKRTNGLTQAIRVKTRLTVDPREDPTTRALEVWELWPVTAWRLPFTVAHMLSRRGREPVKALIRFHGRTQPDITCQRRDGRLALLNSLPVDQDQLYRALGFYLTGETVSKTERLQNPNAVPQSISRTSLHGEWIDNVKGWHFGRIPFYEYPKALADVYKNNRIRAVVRDQYLKALLESDVESLFRSGDERERTIIGATAESLQTFVREEQEIVKRARELQGTGEMRFASVDRLPEALRNFDELNFALVGWRDGRQSKIAELVVVAEDWVYEGRVPLGGEIAGPRGSLRIRGYVSWRDADILFYEEIYKLIMTAEVTV